MRNSTNTMVTGAVAGVNATSLMGSLSALEAYQLEQSAADKAADYAAQAIDTIKKNTLGSIVLPKSAYADFLASAKGLAKTVKSVMLKGLKKETFSRKAAEISFIMMEQGNDAIVRKAGEIISAYGRMASNAHFAEGRTVISVSTIQDTANCICNYYKL